MDTEAKHRLVDDTERQSQAADFSSTPRPADGCASSPAFDSAHRFRDAIETGYNAAQQLVYGELVSLEEAITSVHNARKLL